MGIRKGDPVHTQLKDTVTFNCTCYVVKLPWKSALVKASLQDNKMQCEKQSGIQKVGAICIQGDPHKQKLAAF